MSFPGVLIRGRVSGVPGSDAVFNVDSTGRLGVTMPGTVVAGLATIVGAGTPVCLGTATLYSGVTVRSMQDNSGTVFVGGFAVSRTNGFELAASDTVFVEVDALEQIYVDSTYAGDKVSYIGG